ncbi:RNA methyltransferase [Rhodomicrobium vannielii ATCC 17100]|nr:RNA methyltransferase [Rhodomicrobium vannielii ATCC 17100]
MPFPERSYSMRGYFAIGAERISKPMNLGALMRSAHAFGANFFFTIAANEKAFAAKSDTSKSVDHLPVYHWASVAEMTLPLRCKLVGVELIEGAIDLPAFKHPLHAAYVLGPELGVLSDELLARCDYVIKIPTAFCINVGTAGAIVMYDRMRSLGSFPDRMDAPSSAFKPRSGKLSVDQ